VPGVDAVFDTPADVRRWLERVAEYEAAAP
jgi:hypothetical protein